MICASLLRGVVAVSVPSPVVPEHPGPAEALRKRVSQASEGGLRAVMGAAAANLSDPRGRAVSQLAPIDGASVTPDSLGAVRVRVGEEASALFLRHLG
ncbi:putative dienelactone hydrolase [Streptomyces griseochromogenes]|uniref:Dienelactone hydrolase n=1 Tax=Streptomyces griseochromogenes TaxID=68214 RepID=A0A1B1B0W9_9ACTN|nr:hypothetical protein AVL59_25590 [Streptomyces griseochromogenes]MBP2055940.1 putative dienelactone hydrolase [Streptomyces griseochromogenes]